MNIATTNPIANAMLRHWHEGKRGREFHDAVRGDFPDCSIVTYNAAADIAWSLTGSTRLQHDCDKEI